MTTEDPNISAFGRIRNLLGKCEVCGSTELAPG